MKSTTQHARGKALSRLRLRKDKLVTPIRFTDGVPSPIDADYIFNNTIRVFYIDDDRNVITGYTTSMFDEHKLVEWTFHEVGLPFDERGPWVESVCLVPRKAAMAILRKQQNATKPPKELSVSGQHINAADVRVTHGWVKDPVDPDTP